MNTSTCKEYTDRILNNRKLLTSETNLPVLESIHTATYDLSARLDLLRKDSVQSI